jgi:hypothetical protein
MSIEATLARVGLIKQVLADPAALLNQNAPLSGGTEAPSSSGPPEASGGSNPSSFANALAQATNSYPSSASAAQLETPSASPYTNSLAGTSGLAGIGGYPTAMGNLSGTSLASPTGDPGGRIVATAETQLGQAEQPPGSNESPAIAAYREATAGAVPGAPWCAYFASWAARQAGEPLGPGGEGLGSVSEIWSWAQSSGRAIPNGPGVVPQAGDLIVFGDSHVGIVKEVLPNGQIATIEGNYENKVAANLRSPGEATGYVNMS